MYVVVDRCVVNRSVWLLTKVCVVVDRSVCVVFDRSVCVVVGRNACMVVSRSASVAVYRSVWLLMEVCGC